MLHDVWCARAEEFRMRPRMQSAYEPRTPAQLVRVDNRRSHRRLILSALYGAGRAAHAERSDQLPRDWWCLDRIRRTAPDQGGRPRTADRGIGRVPDRLDGGWWFQSPETKAQEIPMPVTRREFIR